MSVEDEVQRVVDQQADRDREQNRLTADPPQGVDMEPFDVFVRRVCPDFAHLILERFDALAAQLVERERELRTERTLLEIAERERDKAQDRLGGLRFATHSDTEESG